MKRHRFEPARLVLGLLLLGIGALHVLDAVGEADVSTPVLLVLVPAALLVGAAVAVVTFGCRLILSNRSAGRKAAVGDARTEADTGARTEAGTEGAKAAGEARTGAGAERAPDSGG
ncbi:hypothetical protein [Streptomyces phytohabitans]|uniref:hypothetical protein n=1 Tax=Streptomyces phytohabitans TaxID=1150371 RepID=UPI00345B7645